MIRHNKQYVLLFLLIFITFVPPALLYRSETSATFDSTPLERLADANPDYVFIGNSLLLTRIDRNHIQNILKDKTVFFLADRGTATSLWYLQITNYLIPSKTKPRAVFLFFNDTILTKPMAGTKDKYLPRIQSRSHTNEPVLERIFSQNQTLIDRTNRWVHQLYPLYSPEQRFAPNSPREWRLTSLALLLSSPQYWSLQVEKLLARITGDPLQENPFDVGKFLNNIDSTFTEQRLRVSPEISVFKGPENEILNFQEDLLNSFLPDIVERSKQHGVPLVFVRVQTMPNSDNQPQESPALRQYINQLKAYLEDHGLDMHDFTGDKKIPRSFYSDSIHIRKSAMTDYTDVFVKRLQKYFL